MKMQAPEAQAPEAALRVVVRESFALWAVKASFCRYIAGLPDGFCTISDDVRLIGDGRYVLPGTLTGTGDTTVWHSPASLCFAGHGGLLQVELRELRVELNEDAGWLLIAASDGRSGLSRLAHATVTERNNTSLHIGLRLTSDGAALFGGSYLPGEPLDPMHLMVGPPRQPRPRTLSL